MPNVAFGSSFNPYSVELSDIERRRALAEALQKQGTTPLAGTEMVGNVAIQRSPFEGFGKLAQAFAGAQGQKRASAEEKALINKVKESGNVDIQSFVNALSGTPAQTATTPNDDEGNAMPGVAAQSPDRNKALAIALQSQSPILASAGGSMLTNMLKTPDSLFQKIDPKDYTPESIRIFNTTKDASQLVPVRKLDLVSAGGKTTAENLYEAKPGTVYEHTVKPDTVATLKQGDEHWKGLSAYQQAELPIQQGNLAVARGNLGVNQTNSFFNTGMGSGAPPIPQVGAQPPQRAPMVAQASVLPPAQQAAVEADRQKNMNNMLNKREFNMGGINEALNTAESILKGTAGKPDDNGKPTRSPRPTNSMFGSLYDSAGSLIGQSPSGATQADQLKSIGGALVSKVPRMEGPQSDKDVMLYREMAGRIGDDTIPIDRRLAALQTVRQLYAKYEHLNNEDRRSTPRSNETRVVPW